MGRKEGKGGRGKKDKGAPRRKEQQGGRRNEKGALSVRLSDEKLRKKIKNNEN